MSDEWIVDPEPDAQRRQGIVDQLREDAMDAESDGEAEVAERLRRNAHDMELQARNSDLSVFS